MDCDKGRFFDTFLYSLWGQSLTLDIFNFLHTMSNVKGRPHIHIINQENTLVSVNFSGVVRRKNTL